MKFSEIKNFSKVELVKKNQEIAGNLFMAKMKGTLGQLANPLEIRKLRKDLARVQTALTQIRNSERTQSKK